VQRLPNWEVNAKFIPDLCPWLDQKGRDKSDTPVSELIPSHGCLIGRINAYQVGIDVKVLNRF